jgi:hypothetical protein
VRVAERQIEVERQSRRPAARAVQRCGGVEDAQPGEMVSQFSRRLHRTGICTIVDMRSLEIEVDVNESYINRVKDGQPVGRVECVSPLADRRASSRPCRKPTVKGHRSRALR